MVFQNVLYCPQTLGERCAERVRTLVTVSRLIWSKLTVTLSELTTNRTRFVLLTELGEVHSVVQRVMLRDIVVQTNLLTLSALTVLDTHTHTHWHLLHQSELTHYSKPELLTQLQLTPTVTSNETSDLLTLLYVAHREETQSGLTLCLCCPNVILWTIVIRHF